VARERARIDVIAAAGRRSNQEIDAFAGVVITGGDGRRERGKGGERDQRGRDLDVGEAHRKTPSPQRHREG